MRGYSQKSGGAVWRLDRPCRRLIRKRGVQAMFETPDGRPIASRRQGVDRKVPTRREVEAHFHTFERCQSLARAEKDLIVRRALVAMERFHSERATLAIEGGTALVAYHRLTRRFSEDRDIRLIPEECVQRLGTDERIAALKEIGQEFKAHVHAELPFLQPTCKGRIRRDALLQTFIYDYRSAVPDEEVVAGLTCEVAHLPLMMPTVSRSDVGGGMFEAIRPAEIASGKWQALTTRLPRNADSYPDLVRYVHDLAAMGPVLEALGPEAARATLLRDGTTRESVAAVLEELSRPVWRDHYESYMRRMGVLPVTDWPNSHPGWDTVRVNFTALARELGL